MDEISVGARVTMHDPRVGSTGTVVRVNGKAALIRCDSDEVTREIGIDECTAICMMPPPETPVHAGAAVVSPTDPRTATTLFRPVATDTRKRHRTESDEDGANEIEALYEEQKQRTDGINWSPSERSSEVADKEDEKAAAEDDEQSAAASSATFLGLLADVASSTASASSYGLSGRRGLPAPSVLVTMPSALAMIARPPKSSSTSSSPLSPLGPMTLPEPDTM